MASKSGIGRKPSGRSTNQGGLKIRHFLLLPLLLPPLWIGYRQLESFVVRPQAILVLGGDLKREDFAAQFARDYPDLPIWVSGGSPQEYAEATFAKAGIDPKRLHVDRTAADTVTNFTTLVDEFQQRGISSVYLITSDYHMRRSRVIGEVVFGSRGIAIRSIPVPSDRTDESFLKTVRDGGRAIFWVFTGHTGATLNPKQMEHRE